MVKSSKVAAAPSDDQLASQNSGAAAFNADAVPLLSQRSAQSAGKQDSPPSKKAASRKHKSVKKLEGEQEDAAQAALQLALEDWEPPNDKAAKLAHVKTHYHHELFSLSDTKTEDLAEFGQGLALYFYFLKWIAMLLAAMSLVVLPNMVWSGIARNSGTSTTGMLCDNLETLNASLLLARACLSTDICVIKSSCQ